MWCSFFGCSRSEVHERGSCSEPLLQSSFGEIRSLHACALLAATPHANTTHIYACSELASQSYTALYEAQYVATELFSRAQ